MREENSKLKKRIIKIIVLLCVYVAAIFGFASFTDQGNTDMTAEMSSATQPMISFEMGTMQMNLMAGHKKEMDMTTMRDGICPYEGGTLSGMIRYFNESIKTMEYDVYTLDGVTKLYDGQPIEAKELFTLDFGNLLEEGQEAVLKITLCKEEESLYYYTRIINGVTLAADECVDYMMRLHDYMMKKENENLLKSVMEPDVSGDNSTLQHVTIHSSVSQVMWGDLLPAVADDIEITIKEINQAYTSALLSYQVICAGDNNAEETYNVKEFFKVSCQDGKEYLLDYDRTVTEVFAPSNVVLSGKGIILGMTSEDIPYKVNQDGTMAAFVLENQLWSYSMEDDAFALVFSFVDPDKEDERNLWDQHEIQILSMEENGNMTFSVYGYMNRGMHEGESGLVIYYYNQGKNSIDEKVFIPSTKSLLHIEEELNKLAYYNAEQDQLYALIDGNLYKMGLEAGNKEILVRGLEEGMYVTSDDGHMIAYQANGNKHQAVVRNFAEDKIYNVTAESGANLYLFGFIAEDFVYGMYLEENIGHNAAGEEVYASHRLEIRDSKNQVQKTYEVPDTYIIEASIEDNMITLKRALKNGSSYEEIAEDYITNNEDNANGAVMLDTYWTDLKQTQYRLVFSGGLQDTKAKMRQPRYTLYEHVTTLDMGANSSEDYYVVYGRGEQAGRFTEAGEAVLLAKELAGVVISPMQNVAWEDGNRVAWYHNFNFTSFVPREGENSLEACVRKILDFENPSAEVDVSEELETKSAEQVLAEYTDGEGIRFKGCSSKDMFYLIDKGTPVIALKDSSTALLMIGYDAVSVTFVNPDSGSVQNYPISSVDDMVKESGYTFIGYVK